MIATDFYYDGRYLSDLNMVICSFDDKGSIENVSNGAQIEFETVPELNGLFNQLASSKYSDTFTATFQICKDFCGEETEEFDRDEIREVVKWLNRRKFHDFFLVDDEYPEVHYNASFNIERIEYAGKTYGFELTMVTDAAFGHVREIIGDSELSAGGVVVVDSNSDEEGYIYPEMVVKLRSGGTLKISNTNDDEVFVLGNCSSGEVITISYPMIMSSDESHELQKDFNWMFPKVVTSFDDVRNTYTFSLPCLVSFEYDSVVKIGL